MERLLLNGFNHPDPVVRFHVASGAAETPEWRIRHSLLAAATSRKLRTFVFDNADPHFGYEIILDSWRGVYGFIASPVAFAGTGMLAICADLLPSLARRFSGASIFLDRDEFERATQLNRAISEDEAKAQAREIVARVLSTDPGRPLLKAEFWRLMKEKCGRISNKVLERVWRSSVVPENWRRPGRRTT